MYIVDKSTTRLLSAISTVHIVYTLWIFLRDHMDFHPTTHTEPLSKEQERNETEHMNMKSIYCWSWIRSYGSGQCIIVLRQNKNWKWFSRMVLYMSYSWNRFQFFFFFHFFCFFVRKCTFLHSTRDHKHAFLSNH